MDLGWSVLCFYSLPPKLLGHSLTEAAAAWRTRDRVAIQWFDPTLKTTYSIFLWGLSKWDGSSWKHRGIRERKKLQRTSLSGMFLPPWNISFNREASFHFYLENKFFLHPQTELVNRQLRFAKSPGRAPPPWNISSFIFVAVREAPTWRKRFLLLYNDDSNLGCEFKPMHHLLLAVWPWESFLISLWASTVKPDCCSHQIR